MEQPQQESDLKTILIDDNSLLSYVNYNTDYKYNTDKPINWFRMELNSVSETEQEKIEKSDAIKEQIKLGIVQVQQSNTKAEIYFPTFCSIVNSNDVKSVNKKLKIGPNEKCHCGSGKKYKKCHMRFEL